MAFSEKIAALPSTTRVDPIHKMRLRFFAAIDPESSLGYTCGGSKSSHQRAGC